MITHTEIIARWNAQADEHNQWDELGEDEKVEWAFSCGASAVPARPTRQELEAASETDEEILSMADAIIMQRAADARDAARYRWLRNTQNEPCRDPGPEMERAGIIETIFVTDGNGLATGIDGIELDAAIDAAIASQAAKEEGAA